MGQRSAWDRLAEALGLKTDAVNWRAANQRQRMQQYGTMDRRDKQGPTPYFKPGGMQQRRPQATPGSGQQAMAAIPAGADRPGGQVNPLFAPPPRTPRSPLTTAPNSPQALAGGAEGEDEGLDY